MRLADLHPKLDTGTTWLEFDCPVCGNGDNLVGHTIRIPLAGPHGWTLLEGFEVGNLTIQPSIKTSRRVAGPTDVVCFHGFITKGEIEFCADSAPGRAC